MPASKLPRPLRRAESRWTAYEVTEAAQINALPAEPLDIEITPAGKGDYLPTQGKFIPGKDERRHTFSFEECSLGGHVSAFTLLTRYADAYADTDEEWEALAGKRMDTILQLRAYIGSQAAQSMQA